MAGLVVAFSVFMEAYANEFLVSNFAALLSWLTGGGLKRRRKEGESVLQVIQSIIIELTYAESDRDTTLTEVGLSSMTTVILVSEIKKVYKTLKLTVRDVINSETVGELVDVIEGRMKESAARPELSLGKRTSVVAPKALKNIMMDGGATSYYRVADDGLSQNSGRRSRRTRTARMSLALNRISILTDISHDDGPDSRRRSSIGARSRRASFVLDSGTRRPSNRRNFAIGTHNTRARRRSGGPAATQQNTSSASAWYKD